MEAVIKVVRCTFLATDLVRWGRIILNAILADTDPEIEALRFEELEREVAAHREEQKRIMKEIERRVSILEAQRAEQEAQLAEQKAHFAELEAIMAKQKALIAELKDKVSELETRKLQKQQRMQLRKAL